MATHNKRLDTTMIVTGLHMSELMQQEVGQAVLITLAHKVPDIDMNAIRIQFS